MKNSEVKFKIKKIDFDNENNYSKIPNNLWVIEDLKPYEITLLGWLMTHKNGFEMNRAYIAKCLKKDWRTINRHFKNLHDKKYILFKDGWVIINLSKINSTHNMSSHNMSTHDESTHDMRSEVSTTSVPSTHDMSSQYAQDDYSGTHDMHTNNRIQQEGKQELKEDTQQEGVLEISSLVSAVEENDLPTVIEVNKKDVIDNYDYSTKSKFKNSLIIDQLYSIFLKEDSISTIKDFEEIVIFNLSKKFNTNDLNEIENNIKSNYWDLKEMIYN